MAFSSTTKYNYIEVVNHLIPEFYREMDFREFGSEEDVSLTFLGKILKAAIQNDLFFDVSGMGKSGVAQYFVPGNRKTRVAPNDFSRKILAPYKLTFNSFSSVEDIYDFVSGTFLPDAELNNPSGFFSVLSGVGGGVVYTSLSATHDYLIEALGMFYFMNTSSLSSTAASSSAQSLITKALVQGLNSGEVATEEDSLAALFSYFWYNREDSTFYKSFFPKMYASGTSSISANTYASGTQLLDSVLLHLKTWTDARLKNHTFLIDSLETLGLTASGAFPSRMRDAGPFQRFLKAISLGIADINLILEEIGDLLSIDECPEKFLELLGNNIGWRFLTGDYDKWRAQLRNAVLVYKTKGSVIGLDAVLKLIFPDGVFSVSDVSEAWESYIPNLLYYLIKTESFIAKEGLEFSPSFSSTFSKAAPGVKFNQVPALYEDAKNRNYRFLVDAILENLDNKYKFIHIAGQYFKELPMWTCLSGTGFYHRNNPNDPKDFAHGLTSPSYKPITVMVPPWEKHGFYREVVVKKRLLEGLCQALSGTRENFGFEINSAYVEAFKTMLTTAMGSVFSLSASPQWAVNDEFLFFTSGHELPPNYTKFIKYGHTSSLADFDLWNTKSSHIFSVLAASSFDYTVDAWDTYKNKAALETYRNVLREFIPFHVVVRLLLHVDLEDTHCAISNLCVIGDKCVDDFNIEYLRSYRTNFWAGASGTGDLGSTYVNGDGRVLPSYVSGDNTFWAFSATDLARNTSRRRDYRYILPCYIGNRNGKSMPVALDHYLYATSASQASASLDPYINTWEYIVKGFDYGTQFYVDTSSAIWGASAFWGAGGGCSVTGSVGAYSLSDTYPVRAAPEDVQDCSSVLTYRDTLKTILKVMTRAKIREATDPNELSFSDADYKGYSFGTPVHKGYGIYRNEFSSVLKNTATPSIPFYGGYNYISYAFGPTVWNSDFRHRGLITQNVVTPGFILPGQQSPQYGYVTEWSSIVGASRAGGQTYINHGGSSITLKDRTYFSDAPAASSSSALSGIITMDDETGKRIRKTNEILSGLEIRETNRTGKAFIVVNDKDRSSSYNSILGYSLGLYSFGAYDSLEVVFPFKPSLIDDITYNKLRPQSQFRCDIVAKTAQNTKPHQLEVQLFTSTSPLQQYEWAYDWYDKRWRIYDDTKADLFKNILCVSEVNTCPEVHSVEFHTEDKFTDKEVPCGEILFSQDVHTSSTGYVLKIKNITTGETNSLGVIMDGLNLYEISIIDKTLNQLTSHFTSPEIYEIYKFWDGAASGSLSRDSTYSAPYFETAGGSRAEYVELLGGTTYSTSSTIGTVPVALATLEYNMSD